MTRTTYDFAAAQPQLTPGYRLSQSARAPFELVAANREPAVNMPIGGLYSTASDLARLAAALLNDGVVRGERVLPEGVAADVLTPRATLPASETRIGFGTQLMPWEGRPALRVMGGAAGYGVLLHLLTEDRVGVIVLTNKWGNTLSGVADFVFRTTLGLAEAPRATVTPAPVDSAVLAEVASYPGTYLNGSELIEIVVEGGRPRLKSDELVLELRTLPGGAVGVVLDAQIVMSFRLLKDAAGRPYLWIGQRALGRRQR